MTRTEAIKAFLTTRTLPDLAAAYAYGMEVQVNVAQDGGERYDGEYRGKQFTAWTDGEQVWKSFRIPWRAATEPEYKDGGIRFDLAEHADAIGMTGWNWEQRKSIYVAYDFDSVVNHKVGLTDGELYNLQRKAQELPWVTVRRSTSGSGLHLYVYLDPQVETANHTEHAALARAILAKMSGEVGYDFQGAVDAVGGNIWVWARKYEASLGSESPGLELVKEGVPLDSVPVNWRDHIDVASRRRGKSVPHFVKDAEEGAFDEVCGKHVAVTIEHAHKQLMQELDKMGALWWWDSDRHMLVCHTYDLQLCNQQLGLRGVFETLATGAERGTDQNCFAFPLPEGAWVVRRHTKNVKEAPTWDTDASGWTRCYINRLPEFSVAMTAGGGLEDEKSGYVFQDGDAAEAAVKNLGGKLEVPREFWGRTITVKRHKSDTSKLVVTVPKADIDKDIKGWFLKAKTWMKVVDTLSDDKVDILTFDDLVRHLVAESHSDAGWVLKGADMTWVEEPLSHIRLALKAQGHSNGEVEQIMGGGVMNRWKLTNTPFEVEYPGNKVWNKGVQFAVTPALDKEDCQHPTWDKVLDHVGDGLNDIIRDHEWCQENGIVTGADYLKLWVASMFQEPAQPLPYLFLYGPQGSGKSIFHEALSLLVTGGVVRADSALINGSGFNGELANAILCVVEETDLRRDKTSAYNRLKDWTVSQTISIHQKGKTPYVAKNYTHWVHCSNDIEALPIFPGDTRVTMLHVGMLPQENYVAKKVLVQKLKDESAAFLGSLLGMELPETRDRLNVPVLVTMDKLIAEQTNQNELEAFIEECCHVTPGYGMPWKEFYDMFQQWLNPSNRPLWSKRRTGQLLPGRFVKGRNSSDNAQFWIGNVSFRPAMDSDETPTPCRVVGDKIINLIGVVP
jgi:hypothetical protein